MLKPMFGWKKVDPAPFKSNYHRPYCSAHESIREGRTPFTTIRDPWSFYQSLHRYFWAWSEPAPKDFLGKWKLFLDGQDHGRYPVWQKIDVNVFGLMRRHDIGLLTVNYIIECAVNPVEFLHCRQAPEDVEIAIDDVLKIDTLSETLISYLGLNREQATFLRRTKNENVAKGEKPKYDKELSNLIAHKERLIINRFGFGSKKPL